MIDKKGLKTDIEVDGGGTLNNVSEVLEIVDSLKGEMVLVISGATKEDLVGDLLSLSIKEHHKHYVDSGVDSKEALKLVAKDRSIAKSIVYQEIFGKNK